MTRATPRRAPAIWRGGERAPRRDAPAQVSRGTFGVSWRLASGLIVLALILVLVLVFNSDGFYVHSIAVEGLDYMTEGEVFAITGIANMHLFWVDPAQVRRNLLESATIADAGVTVGFGSPPVVVSVQERQPALLWEQAGVGVWVDVRGRIMRQREARDALLRVQVATLVDGPPTESIDADIVAGALQLQQLIPGLTALRYHPDYGLGYTDPRGLQVWFGAGTNMPEKILIYESIVAQAAITPGLARCAPPAAIHIMNPDNPYCSTGN